MSMFQQLIECFNNWDEETFKELHHEDFMFIRETELLNRDEHVSNISQLVKETTWNWQHVATLIHENEFVTEARWEENNEVVTNFMVKKNNQIWRALVCRVEKNSLNG